MIHSFSCKNFYSIVDEIQISFLVNDKAPDNLGYFKSNNGTRLSKVEAVIGPNASGKTNLLKVLPLLKWIIVDAFNLPPNLPIVVQPFKFCNKIDEKVKLAVEFEINDDVYSYAFELDSKRILSEVLNVKNKSQEKYTTKNIFSRTWDEKNEIYNFESRNFDLPKSALQSLRLNASVISMGLRFNNSLCQTITQYWQNVQTNVVESGWIGDDLLPLANLRLHDAFTFYSSNDVLKKEAEKLLNRFDLGLDAININREMAATGFVLNVNGVHKYNGQSHTLPLKYESSGTKQFLVLLKSILQVLNHGGIAILDEIDFSLHPEMLSSLLDMFVQPETNPHNAQILFSTHSHILLSKLDKYQIILTEKNEKGESEVWRLDEMNGVRSDDNYFTKYLAGAYGAIPKIK
jgi:AAA15 family ATPase/GTPase